jgi:hypothetical protein
VGTNGSEDVQVPGRDWFLLRKSGLFLSAQNTARMRDYLGPVLNDSNAQVYFRLVSGMILKSTMEQMGMSSTQARLLLERVAKSGRKFDEVPLAEVGELPRGLDDLYARWDRPMARMAVIPYLVMPLATAHHASGFQHFFSSTIAADGSSDKKCSNMNTASPLSAVQSRIDSTRAKLEALTNGVRNATDLFEKSSREIDRLTGKVQGLSNEIDERSRCLDSIRDRLMRGADMPTPACLAKAKSLMDEAKMGDAWAKFTAANLPNPKGDYSVRQELDLALKILEARLKLSKETLVSLKEKLAKATQELAQNEEKAKKLGADRQAQAETARSLQEEDARLKQELDALQTLRFKLDRRELSDDQIQQAIKDTPERNRRIEAIKARLPAILEAQSKLQAATTVIATQTEFISRAIGDGRVQIRSLESQIGNAQSGQSNEVAGLEKQVADENAKFLKANDAYNFGEYVLSALSRGLTELSQARDAELASLKREEALNATLKTALGSASTAKDGSWESLRAEVAGLESQLAYYRGEGHMGWFLEVDCPVREQLDAGQTGIFISRGTASAKPLAAAPASAVDGGKWGLFNMDYSHFQAAIDGGLLMNLNDYIRTSVEQIVKDLDFAIAQYMDPSAPRCGPAASYGAAAPDLMGTAFAIWDEGGDDQARSRFNCKGQNNKQAFMSSLSRFLEFTGGTLDQALPRTNDAIERQAIQALLIEMRVLSGAAREDAQGPASDQRRDGLIRALIKVLAYDYDEAAGNSQRFQSAQDIRLAGAAPGKEIPKEAAAQLAPDSIQQLYESVRLYTGPLTKSEFDTGLMLKKNDQVKLLSIESPGGGVVRAGWARIQISDLGGGLREFWITASALVAPPQTAQPPAGTGKEVAAATVVPGSFDCPLRRLVTAMHGTVFARMIPEIKLSPAETFWRVNIQASNKTTPASPDKTYVACEVYTQPGKIAMAGVPSSWRNRDGVDLSKTLAVRIVEVKRGPDSKYVPVEEYGGFVTAWVLGGYQAVPRLDLGPPLEGEPWTVIR